MIKEVIIFYICKTNCIIGERIKEGLHFQPVSKSDKNKESKLCKKELTWTGASTNQSDIRKLV